MDAQEKIKLAKKNENIPTAEIENDIRETEAEISTMTQEAEAYEKMPMDRDHRLDHMRASSRRSGIEERKAFIEKLRAILEVRSGVVSETFL